MLTNATITAYAKFTLGTPGAPDATFSAETSVAWRCALSQPQTLFSQSENQKQQANPNVGRLYIQRSTIPDDATLERYDKIKITPDGNRRERWYLINYAWDEIPPAGPAHLDHRKYEIADFPGLSAPVAPTPELPGIHP